MSTSLSLVSRSTTVSSPSSDVTLKMKLARMKGLTKKVTISMDPTVLLTVVW